MNCRRMGVSYLLRVLYCINFHAVCQWKLLRRHRLDFLINLADTNFCNVYKLYT